MRLSPIDKRWEQFASAGVQSSVTGFRGSSKPDGASAASPSVVLFRTFFAQFFTSESISSDDQLRQTRQMQRALAPASQVRPSATTRKRFASKRVTAPCPVAAAADFILLTGGADPPGGRFDRARPQPARFPA
jgi:hypothetical protein